MFLGRYNSLYNSFLVIVTKLEEVVKNLVGERGASERAHQNEINRLLEIHARELEGKDKQIDHLLQFNERLLRIGGIPSLAELSPQEEKRPNTEQYQPTPTTVGAGIIARDKEKTLSYRDYLEAQAKSALAQIEPENQDQNKAS